MFGFFQRHDEPGGFEVAQAAGLGHTVGAARHDAALFKRLAGVNRERSDIAGASLDRQRARCGGPRPADRRRMMVEQLFGKTAAVIVAGAEKEDVGHQVGCLPVLTAS